MIPFREKGGKETEIPVHHKLEELLDRYLEISIFKKSRPLFKGTREIRVILYAKDDSFCAPAPTDELSIEDVVAVEHDVIPWYEETGTIVSQVINLNTRTINGFVARAGGLEQQSSRLLGPEAIHSG
jgi:hypothetical protein